MPTREEYERRLGQCIDGGEERDPDTGVLEGWNAKWSVEELARTLAEMLGDLDARIPKAAPAIRVEVDHAIDPDRFLQALNRQHGWDLRPQRDDGKPMILLDRGTCIMLEAMFKGKRAEDLCVVLVPCSNGIGYGIEERKP